MFFENVFLLLLSDFISDSGQLVPMVSNIECARFCFNTVGCSSFFFSEDLMSCSVSLTRHRNTTGLTPQPGYGYFKVPTEFGMKCNSAADCSYQNSICYQGRCECEVGLSFLAHNMSCMTSCTEYGDDFHAYDYYGIHGYNNVKIYARSGEQCKQTCVDETSFNCINAEYQTETRVCNLSNITWTVLPEANRAEDSLGWVFYYRHCANNLPPSG